VKRTRLYSRLHDLVVDLEEVERGGLVVEFRQDVAVARLHLPRRDPKALLRLTDALWKHDNVIFDLVAHHLRKQRAGGR
jgi:hypothetical protein